MEKINLSNYFVFEGGFFLVCENFKYLKISISTKIVQMPIKQPLRVVLDTP